MKQRISQFFRYIGLFCKNQNGLSLIEILITIGIFSMMLLGVVKITTVGLKNYKQLEFRNDLLFIRQQTNTLLYNGNSCVNTLGQHNDGIYTITQSNEEFSLDRLIDENQDTFNMGGTHFEVSDCSDENCIKEQLKESRPGTKLLTKLTLQLDEGEFDRLTRLSQNERTHTNFLLEPTYSFKDPNRNITSRRQTLSIKALVEKVNDQSPLKVRVLTCFNDKDRIIEEAVRQSLLKKCEEDGGKFLGDRCYTFEVSSDREYIEIPLEDISASEGSNVNSVVNVAKCPASSFMSGIRVFEPLGMSADSKDSWGTRQQYKVGIYCSAVKSNYLWKIDYAHAYNSSDGTIGLSNMHIYHWGGMGFRYWPSSQNRYDLFEGTLLCMSKLRSTDRLAAFNTGLQKRARHHSLGKDSHEYGNFCSTMKAPSDLNQDLSISANLDNVYVSGGWTSSFGERKNQYRTKYNIPEGKDIFCPPGTLIFQTYLAMKARKKIMAGAHYMQERFTVKIACAKPVFKSDVRDFNAKFSLGIKTQNHYTTEE
jgi:Tfp pilus assembly protein PilV